MGILKDVKRAFTTRKVVEMRAEERLYEYVSDEMESGRISRGLWTKAETSVNDHDERTIRAKYIKLRFEQLRAEGTLFQQFVDDLGASIDEEQKNEPKAVEVEQPSVVDDRPEIECPFCHTVNRRFGRCSKCRNTVDEYVFAANRK